MGISTKARRTPLRLSTGAYMINSGLSKFGTDDDTSKQVQARLAAHVPRVEKLDPQVFSKLLAAGEVTLGSAMLLPIVPPVAAGLALTAAGGSILATQRRAPLAKEVWLTGSGLSLLLDALVSPAHDKHVEVSAKVHEKAAVKKRQLRRSRRRAAALGAVSSAQLGEKAHVAGERLHDAGERIAELRDEYQPVAAKKLKQARKKVQKAVN